VILHGANLTFIFWGLLNAIYFIPLLLGKANRRHLENISEGRIQPTVKRCCKILFHLFSTVFGWIFFRAQSTPTHSIISVIFTGNFFVWYEFADLWRVLLTSALLFSLMQSNGLDETINMHSQSHLSRVKKFTDLHFTIL
jgi:D-alanyl-lipoteichoic acid acyltransferase DltB (MBOAT superfamily)